MNNTLAARAAALEDRILAFETAISSALGLPINSVNAASQDDVVVVGRICTDSPGVRPLATSLFLEGSRDTSQGVRVKLDLIHLKNFSVFPGQVVCVRGRNPTGRVLSAHEIIDTLPHDSGDSREDFSGEEGGVRMSESAGQVRVVVACGPYTEASNLAFWPLQHLLEHCSSVPPAVLLLCGPFVPDDHALLGQLPCSFDELFAREVRPSGPVFLSSKLDHIILGYCDPVNSS